jgi:hypothetical protein
MRSSKVYAAKISESTERRCVSEGEYVVAARWRKARRMRRKDGFV